jgi:hypothetical protein
MYGPFEEAIILAARFFLPGGAQLEAYGGAQLVALIAWLGSWAVLHWRLQHRDVSLSATLALFLVCLFLGTLLVWPPITYSLARLAW